MIVKNHKRTIVILSVAAIAILSLCLVYFLFIKQPSAQKIFDKNINGIVELKAQNGEDFQSFGTAVIIDAGGTLITNAHVVTYTSLGAVEEFPEYFVRFGFEKDYRAVTLIKHDTVLDLAILKFTELPPFKLKPVKTGKAAAIKSGGTVYAIGNSMNYGLSITRGIVGIPLVEIEYSETSRKVIQCAITITEGNSGGALLDGRGKLIGITTFRTKDNKGTVIYGLAYCITIETALEFWKG
jgi:S1-C subfamily serine protease